MESEESAAESDSAPQPEPVSVESAVLERARLEALGQETPPTEISFRNRQAVRVALLTAMFTLVSLTVALTLLGQILGFVVALAGGFYAVFLYRQRSGTGLSVIAGARMGWMTGVFTFVFITIITTATLALSSGFEELARAYEQYARNAGLPADQTKRAIDLLSNPFVILGALGLQFLLLTLLCSLGGALGAKMTNRQE